MKDFMERISETIIDWPGFVSLVGILLLLETLIAVVMIITLFCIWNIDFAIVRFILAVIVQRWLFYIYCRKHND